jgi:hypothetical protein
MCARAQIIPTIAPNSTNSWNAATPFTKIFAGKYSEHDYEEIKKLLEIEAARVLAEMDEHSGASPTPATRQAAAERRGS